MRHHGAGKLERRRMRIGTADDVIPFEDELSELFVPTTHRRRQPPAGEAGRGRRGKAEECRHRMAGITGPPADLDLLGVAGIAHDEILRGRIDLESRKQADGQVECPPPCVHR